MLLEQLRQSHRMCYSSGLNLNFSVLAPGGLEEPFLLFLHFRLLLLRDMGMPVAFWF